MGHVTNVISGVDGVGGIATANVITSEKKKTELDRAVQKLVPLEVNVPVQALGNYTKDTEVIYLHTLPRRTAIIEADWRVVSYYFPPLTILFTFGCYIIPSKC